VLGQPRVKRFAGHANNRCSARRSRGYGYVMYLGVVLNPLAGKNRASNDDRCARFRRIVGPWGEVHESRSAGLVPRRPLGDRELP